MTELRLSSYDNRLGLRLGEKVKVTAVTYCGYPSNSNRRTKWARNYPDPIVMTVVGVKKKAVGGVYCSDYPTTPDYNYEPPYLADARYEWFYLCRKSLRSKEYLVDPEHIIILDSEKRNEQV